MEILELEEKATYDLVVDDKKAKVLLDVLHKKYEKSTSDEVLNLAKMAENVRGLTKIKLRGEDAKLIMSILKESVEREVKEVKVKLALIANLDNNLTELDMIYASDTDSILLKEKIGIMCDLTLIG